MPSFGRKRESLYELLICWDMKKRQKRERERGRVCDKCLVSAEKLPELSELPELPELPELRDRQVSAGKVNAQRPCYGSLFQHSGNRIFLA